MHIFPKSSIIHFISVSSQTHIAPILCVIAWQHSGPVCGQLDGCTQKSSSRAGKSLGRTKSGGQEVNPGKDRKLLVDFSHRQGRPYMMSESLKSKSSEHLQQSCLESQVKIQLFGSHPPYLIKTPRDSLQKCTFYQVLQ